MQEKTYYVKGMHCASCEILIEKKLLDIDGIKSVEASTDNARIMVKYDGQQSALQKINEIFKKDNYTFSDTPFLAQENKSEKPLNKTLLAFTIAMVIILAFLLLNIFGIANIFNVDAESSVFAFFAFGLLAGFSSCAALVGGIVLSMSKQWHRLYSDNMSGYRKFQPHAMFNVGRVLSYALFGAVLGFIGSRLQISLGFTAFLVIGVSLLMIALALQMLGVKGFSRFQFSMPKFITRYIANEHNFEGKYMPFLMGAGTFFLPCGFTITVQSLALLSGSPLLGSLMLGFFALGTAPMLLCIGATSITFLQKPHVSATFLKVAGFLVLFFALSNIYNQMQALGYLHQIQANQSTSYSQNNLAPIIDGKQVIKMNVFATTYDPNYFEVKAGVPVRWEINSSGEPSCDSGAVVANGLIDGPIYLDPQQGKITIKEFTPQKTGTFVFSCTMGMVRGTIKVVD